MVLYHKRRLLGILGSVLVFSIVLNSTFTVQASVYPFKKSNYATATDWAPSTDNEKIIWKVIRSWGFTEEATAGIMGNYFCESGFKADIVESLRSWNTVLTGVWCGLGLAQWSGIVQNQYWPNHVGDATKDTRRYYLFKTADNVGADWNQLVSQLAYLKWEIVEGGYREGWYRVSGIGFTTLEDFMQCTDITRCCGVFFSGYEMGHTNNITTWKAFTNPKDEGKSRADYAKDVYNFCKDLNMDDIQLDSTYDSVLGDAEIGNSSSGSSDGTSSLVTVEEKSELDLTGMEEVKNSYIDQGTPLPTLPDSSSLSNYEVRSVQIIRDSVSGNWVDDAATKVRILIAFIGISLLMYSILLYISYIFDRYNNLIDVDLLPFLTHKAVRYDRHGDGRNDSVCIAKLNKIAIVCLVTGFSLLSGSVYSKANWIYRIAMWVLERL